MAEEIGNSDLIKTWASDGAQETPDDTKIEQGWLSAERPAFQFMNWLFNSLGQKINHIMSNGMPLWKASRTYTANQVVLHNGAIYKAIGTTTNETPSATPLKWTQISL